MKLINAITQKAYPVDKVGPYPPLQGELSVEKKEQSIEWEFEMDRFDAVLLGAPRIEILPTSKKGDLRLIEECLFSVKIDGEPVLENAPILHQHSRLFSSKGPHCWFEASENDERCGIFVTNGAKVKAIVLAQKVVPVGIHLRITIDGELYKGQQG